MFLPDVNTRPGIWEEKEVLWLQYTSVILFHSSVKIMTCDAWRIYVLKELLEEENMAH